MSHQMEFSEWWQTNANKKFSFWLQFMILLTFKNLSNENCEMRREKKWIVYSDSDRERRDRSLPTNCFPLSLYSQLYYIGIWRFLCAACVGIGGTNCQMVIWDKPHCHKYRLPIVTQTLFSGKQMPIDSKIENIVCSYNDFPHDLSSVDEKMII